MEGLIEPVVVTGVGTVGTWGSGLGALAGALARSQSAFETVDRSQGFHPGGGTSTLAGLVKASALAEWLSPAAARRMSPPSKFAVAAASMALADAGLGPSGEDTMTAVVFATSFGPASFSERLFSAYLKDGPETASPFLFTECVANAPAAQVAIFAKARGMNATLVGREAGPLLALSRGAREVRAGRAQRALVGAVDEITPLVHAILDRFRALSPTDVPRPFDRGRDGVVAAEGATVLVLEPESAARLRGARPLARIVSGFSAFDPSASRTGWGTSWEALARALLKGLERAGSRIEGISRVVSGASGSVAGDLLEARVLRGAFSGRPLPPVFAPKGVTGEYGGGFLAASLLAAQGVPFGPTAGFRERDPDLGLSPYMGEELPPPGRTLLTSLAAGGAAAWALLERP